MTEEIKVLEEETKQDDQDFLKDALEDQFHKIQTQGMLLGLQTACQVILKRMSVWEKQPGKRTLNDHRRLIKDIKQFCEVGISKKVNLDDNTKLTEETNESNINESDN